MEVARDALAGRFPPNVLREYAVLADGERAAVLGPRGDYVWMCAPRWDSPSVFGELLGGAGVYAAAPAGGRFVWGGSYERRSMIWRSRWVIAGAGGVECREALAFPGDRHTAVILRRLTALDNPVPIRVQLDVRSGFGADEMSELSRVNGVWTGRSGPCRLRWSGAPGAHVEPGAGLTDIFELAPGRDVDLVLELSDREFADAHPVRASRAWAATAQAWARAVPPVSGTLADGDCEQAHAVLHGLTSAAGGMAAAATMSLPERAGQGRNYDYRYSWIRDQCYAGQALAVGDSPLLLDRAVDFVSARALEDGPDMRPAYTVSGGEIPEQRALDLPGYPGADDVRAGNQARKQFQLDVFGEALLLLGAAGRLDRLDRTHWRAVETLVAAVEARWMEPDAGIWELDDRRWAHSRLTCAAGLRRVSEPAAGPQAASWRAIADRLVADTTADCLHRSGRWQRAPDDPGPDAALLLPGIRGALSAGDPRTIATVRGVDSELSQDGFVYRFAHSQGELGDAEGAFLVCGYFMALADHQQGDVVAAARWFERGRSACGSPGLFTEEFDVGQRQLRGNLPQAFVHALLFESAHVLAQPVPGRY